MLQADVADGENRQRIGHGPKTSGKKRPNNQVRRPANIRADGGGAENQGRQAPAREKNADDHDERNDHRRDANGNELRWRFRGAEPGSRSEAGKDAEQLKFFSNATRLGLRSRSGCTRQAAFCSDLRIS